MKLLKNLATVSAFTFLSRILGYIRDRLLAEIVGANAVADAFLFAWKLPNIFRRLFAEGAFSTAFVPLLSSIAKEESQKESLKFIHQTFSFLSLSLLLLVIIFEIAMPYIMRFNAMGFYLRSSIPIIGKDLSMFELTVYLARILFPYIFFISLAAHSASILIAYNRFSAATAAPIFLNLFAIIGLLFFNAPNNLIQTSTNLGWIIVFSGFFQWIFLWSILAFSGIKIRFTLRLWSPKIRKLLLRMGPGMIGAGVYQLNLFTSDIIASFIPTNAISYLAYADRLNQLPLSLIGISMGTVLLPLMAKYFQTKKLKEALRIQNQALVISFYLSIPAAAALFYLSLSIVQTLFPSKLFSLEIFQAISNVLKAFLLGLPAYVGIKILGINFFSRGDTKTPVRIAFIAMICNISLNILLAYFFSYVGIALGTSIAGWINFCLLAWTLHSNRYFYLDKEDTKKILYIGISSLIMLFFLSLMDTYISHIFFSFSRVIYLIIQIFSGFILYLILSYIFGIIKKEDILMLLRRNKQRS